MSYQSAPIPKASQLTLSTDSSLTSTTLKPYLFYNGIPHELGFGQYTVSGSVVAGVLNVTYTVTNIQSLGNLGGLTTITHTTPITFNNNSNAIVNPTEHSTGDVIYPSTLTGNNNTFLRAIINSNCSPFYQYGIFNTEFNNVMLSLPVVLTVNPNKLLGMKPVNSLNKVDTLSMFNMFTYLFR